MLSKTFKTGATRNLLTEPLIISAPNYLTMSTLQIISSIFYWGWKNNGTPFISVSYWLFQRTDVPIKSLSWCNLTTSHNFPKRFTFEVWNISRLFGFVENRWRPSGAWCWRWVHHIGKGAKSIKEMKGTPDLKGGAIKAFIQSSLQIHGSLVRCWGRGARSAKGSVALQFFLIERLGVESLLIRRWRGIPGLFLWVFGFLLSLFYK